jgi:hypothetical protein
MNYPKTALLATLMALSLAATSAGAQQDPPKPAPEAQPEQAELPLQPVVPPKRKPIKRRSVQQVIEPTPRIGTAPPSYGPTLTPRPPAALPDPLPAPVRTNGCDAGGCNDTSGQRYNGGVGNTLLGPQGQLCTKGVVGAQCF